MAQKNAQNTTPRFYLDLFFDLSRIISQSSDLSQLVRSAMEMIQRVMGVKNCSIMLMNPEGTALTMRASSVITPELWKSIHIDLGKGVAGKVARNGRAVLVTPGQTAFSAENNNRSYETDSFICAPLAYDGKILGVVNVTDHEKKRSLTPTDLEVVEAIARFIASAVHNHFLWLKNRESREHLTQVLEGIPLGMFTISENHRLTLCNRAAQQFLGMKEWAAEAEPKSWEEYFLPGVRTEIAKALETMQKGQESYSSEFQIAPLEDEKRQRSVRISALPTESFGYLDQSHILFMVEDLQQMRELWELRRSDQMKSTFLSLISHELRTPLASIKGSIHLLNQITPPELRERSDRLFAILHRNSDRLARLVNNILDVLDLESHTLQLYRKRTDMRHLVTRIAQRFKQVEFEKVITWEVDCGEEEQPLYIDESRMGQVVDQLLENATKFTDTEGSVAVESAFKEGCWELRVANSGKRIEKAYQDKVFSRFYQIDNTLTREYGGSGLGLYICREIVALHNGRIFVDSAFEEGTRIIVQIPQEEKTLS